MHTSKYTIWPVFTELAPKPIQPISFNGGYYVVVVYPLGVTSYWRGIETSSQKGSFLFFFWKLICLWIFTAYLVEAPPEFYSFAEIGWPAQVRTIHDVK